MPRQTYSALGTFAGYEPYLGANAPDVLWTEGTAEMLVAAGDLGQSTLTGTVSLLALAAVTPGQAPLTANRTITSAPYGVEYHVWPGAAAGAWSLIALERPTFTLFR